MQVRGHWTTLIFADIRLEYMEDVLVGGYVDMGVGFHGLHWDVWIYGFIGMCGFVD